MNPSEIVLLAIGIAVFGVPAILVLSACIAKSNDSQGKAGICSKPTRLGYEAGEED